jgi:hypothetical protein
VVDIFLFDCDDDWQRPTAPELEIILDENCANDLILVEEVLARLTRLLRNKLDTPKNHFPDPSKKCDR